MGMRICVLTGSPHLKGTSNTLAEEWMRGAQEAGHTVERCDCARPNLHPCLGCGHCGMDDPCVHGTTVKVCWKRFCRRTWCCLQRRSIILA